MIRFLRFLVDETKSIYAEYQRIQRNMPATTARLEQQARVEASARR